MTFALEGLVINSGTQSFGYLGSAVGRIVVDDDYFEVVTAFGYFFARESLDDSGYAGSFVVARNDDGNIFHEFTQK